jgi:predicted nucleic acid-binding Zn ribbon protein
MPLYEFLCNNPDCDTDTFEVLSSYEQDQIVLCNDCGEGTRDRKMFYQFDFRM